MGNNTNELQLFAADVSWSDDNYIEGDITSLDLQMKNWRGFPYHENLTN